MIPSIKKEINKFIYNERGNISNKNLMKLGLFSGTVMLSQAKIGNAEHGSGTCTYSTTCSVYSSDYAFLGTPVTPSSSKHGSNHGNAWGACNAHANDSQSVSATNQHKNQIALTSDTGRTQATHTHNLSTVCSTTSVPHANYSAHGDEGGWGGTCHVSCSNDPNLP